MSSSCLEASGFCAFSPVCGYSLSSISPSSRFQISNLQWLIPRLRSTVARFPSTQKSQFGKRLKISSLAMAGDALLRPSSGFWVSFLNWRLAASTMMAIRQAEDPTFRPAHFAPLRPAMLSSPSKVVSFESRNLRTFILLKSHVSRTLAKTKYSLREFSVK